MVLTDEPRFVSSHRSDVHLVQVLDGVGEWHDIVPVSVEQPNLDCWVETDTFVLGDRASGVDVVVDVGARLPILRSLAMVLFGVGCEILDNAVVRRAFPNFVGDTGSRLLEPIIEVCAKSGGFTCLAGAYFVDVYG